MKVAVLQSNYVPWRGYFDIIHDVELFIFHDDLQYTKNDWRNRNRIVTEGGTKWISVPVGTDEHRLILDVKMTDAGWQKKHFDMLRASYRKAPFFEKYRPFLEYVYLETKWDYLYELDRYLIETISRIPWYLDTVCRQPGFPFLRREARKAFDHAAVGGGDDLCFRPCGEGLHPIGRLRKGRHRADLEGLRRLPRVFAAVRRARLRRFDSGSADEHRRRSAVLHLGMESMKKILVSLVIACYRSEKTVRTVVDEIVHTFKQANATTTS